MNAHPTVLILYAKYGAGHIQVAEALKQAFEQETDAHVVLLDLFHEAHPIIDDLSKFIYRKSFTWFPRLYGWSYYRTKEMSHDTLSSRLFNSFGMHTLKETIRTLQPGLVINTFPMLVMPEFRRQTGQRIPTVAVLTDFVSHNRWIHPEIDKYYVATEDLAEQLLQKGISQERIVVSGIPIRSAFQTAEDAEVEKRQLAQKYNLRLDKQKVLLVAGGYGVAWNWQEIIQSFHDQNYEIVVVCGNNDAVREELQTQTGHMADVHIFGYVEHLEELMKTADVLVTKAGGITLAEAMSLSLPILILSPVPGQELENARYLEARGVARIIKCREEIAQIHTLVQSLRRDHNPLVPQQSAQRVVSDICNSWKEVMERRGTNELLSYS